MIRPKWLALPATGFPRRCISHKVPRDPQKWAIPKLQTDEDEFREFRSPKVQLAQALRDHEQKARQASIPRRRNPHKMLTLVGITPSLTTGDFDRLGGKGLAQFKLAPTEVSQDRDPWTLDPLGSYRVTFDDGDIASAIRERIARLHKLAQIKLHSKTGLWETEVPLHLRGEGVSNEEIATFTLAPGSKQDFKVEQSRVKGQWVWKHLIKKIAANSQYPASRAGVLLELDKVCLKSSELLNFINADGVARNLIWNVSKPYHLVRTIHETDSPLNGRQRLRASKDAEGMDRMRRRFVLVCENEDVAWQFIRAWNQRVLSREFDKKIRRTVVNASLIEW